MAMTLLGLVAGASVIITGSPLPVPSISNQRSLCNETCSALSQLESETDFNKIGCALLDASSATANPVLSLCGVLPDNKHIRHYFKTENEFLSEVSSHKSFRGPVGIVVKFGDNGTLSSASEQYLRSKHIAFLSQAHVMVPEHQRDWYILQPDFNFIHWRGYASLVSRLDRECPPFENRTEVVFWRGSSTDYIGPTCEDVPRVRMVQAAESIPWIDAKITNYVRFCLGRGAAARRVPEVQWCQRKGILDIDGNTNAGGLLWRLASGSVVFKVHSLFDCHICRELRPWVHYIPLSRSLQDLAEGTAIIANRSRTEELAKVSRAAKDLVRRFSYENELLRVVRALSSFSSSN